MVHTRLMAISSSQLPKVRTFWFMITYVLPSSESDALFPFNSGFFKLESHTVSFVFHLPFAIFPSDPILSSDWFSHHFVMYASANPKSCSKCVKNTSHTLNILFFRSKYQDIWYQRRRVWPDENNQGKGCRLECSRYCL